MQAMPKDISSNPAGLDPGVTASQTLHRIFELHHERAAYAAYRVTGSASDAEDALQTVFLRLLGKAPPGAPEDLGPYMRRAAVNAALDILRRRKRQRAVSLDDQPAPPPDPRPSPQQQGLGSELGMQLRRALATLSPRSAEIFVLRFLEGYGNKEIASMLGTTQNAVGVTLHRVREQMRRELGEYVGEAS